MASKAMSAINVIWYTWYDNTVLRIVNKSTCDRHVYSMCLSPLLSCWWLYRIATSKHEQIQREQYMEIQSGFTYFNFILRDSANCLEVHPRTPESDPWKSNRVMGKTGRNPEQDQTHTSGQSKWFKSNRSTGDSQTAAEIVIEYTLEVEGTFREYLLYIAATASRVCVCSCSELGCSTIIPTFPFYTLHWDIPKPTFSNTDPTVFLQWNLILFNLVCSK